MGKDVRIEVPPINIDFGCSIQRPDGTMPPFPVKVEGDPKRPSQQKEGK